jgi:beta-glucosidase-like glycosyl hydrolase
MVSRQSGVALVTAAAAGLSALALAWTVWALGPAEVPSASVGAQAAPNSPALSPPPSVTPSVSAAPVATPAPTISTPTVERNLAWGPSQDQWRDALATASAMPLKEAAGQVIVASYAGTSPTTLRSLIESKHLGGVMLQGDATSKKKVTRKLTSAAASAGGGRDWPVMISVDQEGGTVARLRGMIPDMPGFMAAGASTDKDAVRDAYANQGWYVRDMGFNLNFAPDADVTVGLSDPIIRTRSAGSDAPNVSATVDAALAGDATAGLATSIKHFPGHGSVEVDSHKDLPVQDSSIKQLEGRDLEPFAKAIDAGAPSVMVGHIALAEWGDSPASLAPAAYAYLRDKLGFTGVAITDALNMGAIVNEYEPGEASVAALKAGADVVLLPANVDAALSGIVSAVTSGDLSRARLDEAAARSILMMRWQSGLAPSSADAPASTFAQDFAARSATVVTPTCGVALVSQRATVLGGLDGEREELTSALADRGIGAGTAENPGTTVYLAGNSSENVKADVVVAMDGPWVLEKSTARTYIALYGRSDDSIQGLADVLVGGVTSQSAWPVTMTSMPSDPC